MKNRITVLITFILLPLTGKAEVSCIGIYTKNPETAVTQQHAVTFLNCACNCAEHSWLDNSRCVACGHSHAQAPTAGISRTNGTFFTFTSASDALTLQPKGSTQWLTALKAYAQDRAVHHSLDTSASSFETH